MATQRPLTMVADPCVDVKQHLTVPAQHVQQPPLPAGWLEAKDSSGRSIYVNSATGMTYSQRPAVRRLPPGWIKAQTPDGKSVFINTENQEISYEWPKAAANPAQQTTCATMPQITPYITTHAQSLPLSNPAAPRLTRSTTAPVRPVGKAQDPALLTMTVNTDVARKAIPGFEEALAIHQLSERNNSQVLGKKLGADMLHASAALKGTTITAASLATRQAKAVGQTMVSATKMQKVSKKAIVQTGAFGVKIGRASKSLMGEMIDAADGKGKYKPKHRMFVPQDPLPMKPLKPILQPASVHLYEHQQATNAPALQHSQQVVISPKPAAGIPARKPLKRPSINVSLTADASLQFVAPPNVYNTPIDQIQPPISTYVETADAVQHITTTEQPQVAQAQVARPPRPSDSVNNSIEISAPASASIQSSSPIVTNSLQTASEFSHTGDESTYQFPSQQNADPAAHPASQTAVYQLQTPSAHTNAILVPHSEQTTAPTQPAFLLQANASLGATLTYPSQSGTMQPPPPYSPQVQRPPIQRPPTAKPPRPVAQQSNQASQHTSTVPSQSTHLLPTQSTHNQLIQQVQHVQQVQQIQQNQQNQQGHYVQYVQRPSKFPGGSQPQMQHHLQQQTAQQVIIQQPATNTSNLQSSNASIAALQQQIQALQLQAEMQQMQDSQQQQQLYEQQILPSQQQSMATNQMQQAQMMQQQQFFQQQQLFEQQQQQQQQIHPAQQEALTVQQVQQQPQEEIYYYVDDNTTATYAQQDPYATSATTTNPTLEDAMYAQQSTTTQQICTTPEGDVLYVEEEQTAVYDQSGDIVYAEAETEVLAYDADAGTGGEIVYGYAEEEGQVWEVDDGVDAGGFDGLGEDAGGGEFEVNCEC